MKLVVKILSIFLFLGTCGLAYGMSLYGGERLDGTRGGNADYWLAVAAYQEDDEKFDKLLEEATDVNVSTNFGRMAFSMTPLMAATVRGNVAMVKKLLKKEAKPNIEDDILRKLDDTILFGMYAIGLKEMPQFVYNIKITPYGMQPAVTPLFVAVSGESADYKKIAELLLDYGAKITITYIGNDAIKRITSANLFAQEPLKSLILEYAKDENKPTRSLAEKTDEVSQQVACPITPSFTVSTVQAGREAMTQQRTVHKPLIQKPGVKPIQSTGDGLLLKLGKLKTKLNELLALL